MFRFNYRSCRLSIALLFGISIGWLCAYGDDRLDLPPQLVVTRDGQPFTPHHVYDLGLTALGGAFIDVGVVLNVGSEKEFHFVVHGDETENDTVFLKSADQSLRIVGVKVSERNEFNQEHWVNPLASLSNDEIHGLWGLELNHWSDEIANQIKLIDLDRTCVTICDRALKMTDHGLPPLP
jgi:hypothetical protein